MIPIRQALEYGTLLKDYASTARKIDEVLTEKRDLNLPNLELMYDPYEKIFIVEDSQRISVETLKNLFKQKKYDRWEPEVQDKTNSGGNKKVQLVRQWILYTENSGAPTSTIPDAAPHERKRQSSMDQSDNLESIIKRLKTSSGAQLISNKDHLETGEKRLEALKAKREDISMVDASLLPNTTRKFTSQVIAGIKRMEATNNYTAKQMSEKLQKTFGGEFPPSSIYRHLQRLKDRGEIKYERGEASLAPNKVKKFTSQVIIAIKRMEATNNYTVKQMSEKLQKTFGGEFPTSSIYGHLYRLEDKGEIEHRRKMFDYRQGTGN